METVTFRIASEIRSKLTEEARRSGTSLNSLVSQILSTYDLWGRQAKELGLLPFNKAILRELFNVINRDSLEAIAKRAGETVAREEIIFLFNEVSPETVRRYIELRGTHFSAYHHRYENGRHYFTLQHDLGINFSLFLKGYLSAAVKSAIEKTLDFWDTSPNSVSFSIPH